MYWRAERGHSRLPIVMSGVARNVGARVTFAVAAILRNDDRSGQIVRAQGEAGIAHAPGESPQQIFRADVLVINLTADFGIVSVLALSSHLLDQFVGDGVTSFAARNRIANGRARKNQDRKST